MSNPRRPKPSDSQDIFAAAKPKSPEGPKKSLSPTELSLDDEDLQIRGEFDTAPVQRDEMAVDASFGAGQETDASSAPKPTRRQRELESLPSAQQRIPGKLDAIGKYIPWLLLPVLFVGIFYTILKKRPPSDATVLATKPSLPIQGRLVKISDASSGWKERKESDRVSAEAQVITKTTVYPTKLPELRLKLSSSAPSAFVRVLFFNSEGKIAGDPRVVKIVDGKLQSTDKTDQIVGADECVLTASTGLQTELQLIDYFASDKRRWSVELSESSNYQAKGDEWKLLETFAIADKKL